MSKEGDSKGRRRPTHFELNDLGPRSYETIPEHTTRRWLALLHLILSTPVTGAFVYGGIEGKFSEHYVFVIGVLYYLTAYQALTYFFGKQQLPEPIKRMLPRWSGRSGGSTTDDE